MRKLVPTLVFLSAVVGCGSSDSDGAAATTKASFLVLDITSELDATAVDALTVEVSGSGSTYFLQTYDLGPNTKLPATLTLVPNPTASGAAEAPAGSLNPGTVPTGPSASDLTVRVQGLKAGKTRIERVAKVTLPNGEGRRLVMPMQSTCVDFASVCAADQSCDAGSCSASDVATSALPVTTDAKP